MKINGVEIENTYCEAFDGLFSRILITADDRKRLEKAAISSTALPCTVFGEAEGGIDYFLPASETPDKREGAVVQIWVNFKKNAEERLAYELAKRIRQGILVVPTTRIFNYLPSDKKMDMMDRVGHCGDGYEVVEEQFGREMIDVPLMMGSFLIERYISYAKGVMGGNVWFMCSSTGAALEAGDIAVEAIGKVRGAITSFDICSAGSKVETKYPEIGPTTNHPFCPTLKGKIPDFKVPEGVVSIPEIVIDGINEETVRKAMKVAIDAASTVDGVLKITAGNYGGNLGKYNIYLRDLLLENK